MSKVAIVTDTNSGISKAKAEKYGVFTLPMSFNIDGEQFYEGLSITHNEFFDAQVAGAKIFTSQPSPAEVMDIWDEVLKDYDQVIHIPMAQGLSSSYQTAAMLAGDYDGKVIVINNQRVSVSLKQSVLDAKAMADAGLSAEQIRNNLFMAKDDASIYVTIDDMKYLKAGGRISASAATIGTVLNIKPVLSVNGGVIEAAAKVRGLKAARKQMIQLLEADMERKFNCTDISEYHIYTAAALRRDEAIAWNDEVEAHFGQKCQIETLPLSLCAHVGVGAFGACLCKKLKF